MKRFLILFAILFPVTLYGQGYRFDSQVTAEVVTSAIPVLSAAGVANILTIPSSVQVAFCSFPANAVPCTNKATTYTSVTLGTPCSTSTQITLTGSTTCVASPDAQQNWGVWVPSGQYSYTLTLPGGVNLGPYIVNFGVPNGTNLALGTLSTTGPANFGSSITTQSSVIINSGSLLMTANDSYVQWEDNNFAMFIQAGPRTGGGFSPLLGLSTFTLPDLCNGGTGPCSGGLLGITGATIASSSGHCLFSSGSSQGGLMIDSHIGCNSNLTLPAPTNGMVWPNSSNSIFLDAQAATGARTLTLQDASGPIGPATLTLKTGSGSGNYTGTNTAAFASVDTTNLCTAITIPVGWKLKVDASAMIESVTAAVAQSFALADAGTTCTSGGVTALAGTERDITPPAIGTFDVGLHTQYIFSGDGVAHSFSLVAKTSNAADAWGVQNTSAAAAPSMTFTLMPSN